jgi:hypothetical protein
MATSTLILVLIPSLIAAIVSVTVPWVTFRLAVRQDRGRRLDERRAELYVDMLLEAHAERQWFEHEVAVEEARQQADEEARERMRRHFVDLRLSPLERARLGARGTAFASAPVNRAFNRLQSVMAWATLTSKRSEAERLTDRVHVAEAFAALETAIRRELGADERRSAFAEGWEAAMRSRLARERHGPAEEAGPTPDQPRR